MNTLAIKLNSMRVESLQLMTQKLELIGPIFPPSHQNRHQWYSQTKIEFNSYPPQVSRLHQQNRPIFKAKIQFILVPLG